MISSLLLFPYILTSFCIKQCLGPSHPEKDEVTYENSRKEANRVKNRYQDIVACKLLFLKHLSIEQIVSL